MKIQRFYLLGLVLLLFSLRLNSQGKNFMAHPQGESKEPFVRFVSKENGFSIAFPKSWQQKKGFSGTAVAAVRPPMGPNESFRENINVTVDKQVPKSWTLKSYANLSLANAQKYLPQYNQTERGKTMLDRHPAEWAIYTFHPGAYDIKALVFISVRGNHGYVITCASLPDRFSQWQKTFERIAKTFKYL